jgi:hypothetical protein
VRFPKTVIGFGLKNNGSFNDQASGIAGFGGGSLSLISQMGSSVGRKISYCLVPFLSQAGRSSKLNFGSHAVVSGHGVKSTPLLTDDTFYYLTLEVAGLGKERIQFGDSSPGTGSGNIITDSGTTLTIVPEDVLNELSKAADNQVEGRRAEDPSGFLSLCYNHLKVPIITTHISLVQMLIVQISYDLVCLA